VLVEVVVWVAGEDGGLLKSRKKDKKVEYVL
jgi:hypothetical protein